MKKVISILVILSLVLAACSQNSNESEMNDYKKMEKDNQKYKKEIKKLAKNIVKIADKHDEHMDEDDTTDAKTSKFVKELECDLKENREAFEKNTKNLLPNDTSLGDFLIKESKLYETLYNTTSKIYKLSDDKDEYLAPTIFALDTIVNEFNFVGYEMQYDYDDIEKSDRNDLLGEKLSNDLDETLVVTDGELEEGLKDFGILMLNEDKIEIPEDEFSDFNVDDAAWKMYKISGVQDEDKDITKKEYNEDVESYNDRVHPILKTKKINEPTTMTINNHLISKMNAIVEAEDDYEE
ncbi:hypothetical protein [Mammaliicoccus lentus]|uniref:hypothetical protein n=1 Tax=Mammaliicoccus lentus TaxID=42858 RepID=UPI0026496C01|nr:hypothetical protein [Mammaliicoccus lentus]